jgi:hypothetical protein
MGYGNWINWSDYENTDKYANYYVTDEFAYFQDTSNNSGSNDLFLFSWYVLNNV